MANPILRRVMKFMLLIVFLAAIFVGIALFFAFGGDNPILVHIGNFLDIILMGLTFVLVVAVIYRIVLMTGYGAESQEKVKPGISKSQTVESYDDDDEFPDFSQLVDNMESAETSKR